MSEQYSRYLTQHRKNVVNGAKWLIRHKIINPSEGFLETLYNHDASKYSPEEYDAYDKYFYGPKTVESTNNFNYAWLHHIHNNPHHWQYWILIEDDERDPVLLDIPDEYIYEMICDWWSFSWNSGNLYEIFDWWNEHKTVIRLSKATQAKVYRILHDLKACLDEDKKNG